MSRKVQLMTNNESDLGESMDAAVASSSPSDQSVKFELNQTIVIHLGANVALSIIAGLGLLLVRFGTEFNFFASIWMGSLGLCYLLVWLCASPRAKTQTTAFASIAVYALFWGLAAPMFINGAPVQDAILISTLIIIVSVARPGFYLQAD
jgi:hypothetical protein